MMGSIPSIMQVSVVMCTYNGACFIDEQVQSILSQNHQHFELIIVDDQSTDDTWSKLISWKQKDKRISLYKNEVNLGYNKNFEEAIRLANGDFIAISDQDDIWLPTKLSKTLSAFKEPGVVLAHCKSVRLQDYQLKFHLAKLHRHFSGNDTRKLFFFNQAMGHDMIFKRELVPHIVPVPPGMSYDWWITVLATCYGVVAGVDEYLVHHRIHSANNYFSNTAASKKKELDIDETLELFLTIPEMQSEYKNYLQEFLHLLKRHKSLKSGSFDRKLFWFMYSNRHIIFGHKRRFLKELSYLKNAIKYAKMDYSGRGISI